MPKPKSKVKKKAASAAKVLYDRYKDRLWELLVNFIEDQTANIGKWVENITHFKQKIRKTIVALTLIFAGVFLILLGLGDWLAEVLFVSDYVGRILIGFIAIVFATIYNKT